MLITIEVPEKLGRQLRAYEDRLPELLELGLREVESPLANGPQDAEAIIGLLASRPGPEQILAIRPSSDMVARFSELLQQSKSGTISREAETELERYLMLEHLIRLAKARALKDLSKAE